MQTMKKKIKLTTLAVDLGTTSGWALCLPNGQVLSGTWNFKPKRGDGTGMRYLRLQAKLDEMHDLYTLKHIIYELPAGVYRSGSADDTVKGLVAHVQSWSEANGVPSEGFAPSQIKKFAVGRGNAKKDEIFAAAKAKWGEAVLDHNQGDALWLLDLAGGCEI
jgi:hypothetical protein